MFFRIKQFVTNHIRPDSQKNCLVQKTFLNQNGYFWPRMGHFGSVWCISAPFRLHFGLRRVFIESNIFSNQTIISIESGRTRKIIVSSVKILLIQTVFLKENLYGSKEIQTLFRDRGISYARLPYIDQTITIFAIHFALPAGIPAPCRPARAMNLFGVCPAGPARPLIISRSRRRRGEGVSGRYGSNETQRCAGVGL